MSNASSKTNRKRSKHALSNQGGKILQTRHSVKSVFQRGEYVPVVEGSEKADNVNFAAVVEQVGLDGFSFKCEVKLPLNSYLWRKLPYERKASED